MKKYYLMLCLLCITTCGFFFSCNKQEATKSKMEKEYLSQFYSGDVLVTITEGAPISTRSNPNVKYFTVTGQLNETVYSLYEEREEHEDGLIISKAYTQGGTWFYTDVYFEGKLISRELSNLEGLEENDVAETRASRRRNESYVACVRRVHEKLENAFDDAHPVMCEFVPCGQIAAVCAIIDCNEYGDQW